MTNSLIIKGDYAALYPTTQITWNIEPTTDFMHVTLPMLMHVLNQREYHKGLKKASENKAETLYNELLQLDKESEEYGVISKKRDAILADKINHDNQQLVLKKLANSWFGSLGCPSVNPWGDLVAAEKTTCIGRQLLRLMISYLKNLGYTPIVGDSFTGDTPVFIKYNSTGLIDIVPIEELVEETEMDEFGREYDTSEKSYKVLCRSGWVAPSYIYRHKTDKQLYEVSEGNMTVCVTEDHSLFDSKKRKIKPNQINRLTRLEYYSKIIVHKTVSITRKEIITEAMILKNGLIDRVPKNILNLSDKESITLFLEKLDGINYLGITKTCRAGILFLKNQLI